jgi:LysM repeat protein
MPLLINFAATSLTESLGLRVTRSRDMISRTFMRPILPSALISLIFTLKLARAAVDNLFAFSRRTASARLVFESLPRPAQPVAMIAIGGLYRGLLGAIVVLGIFIVWDSVHWISEGGPNIQRPRASAAIGNAAPQPVATQAGGSPAASTTPAVTERSHTVVPGDTVSTIAEQYNVQVGQIISLNGLADPEVIKVGQVLRIPPG